MGIIGPMSRNPEIQDSESNMADQNAKSDLIRMQHDIRKFEPEYQTYKMADQTWWIKMKKID